MAKKKFEYKRYQYKLSPIGMSISEFNKLVRESLDSIWSKYGLNTITTTSTLIDPNPTTITTNWASTNYSWDVISPSVSNYSVRFNDAWDTVSNTPSGSLYYMDFTGASDVANNTISVSMDNG